MERGQWGSARNRTVPKSGARWGSGSGTAPQCAPFPSGVLWCALVGCCVGGSWGTGWREGSGVQPATERFRSRVRVGIAGPGRRPSARHCALFPSGPRWSGAVLSGPGVREYWSTGVLEYWSWREGSGVQPATERFRSRVRVGMAGPGRRPSARQCALVPSGARRPPVALPGPGVQEYWSTPVRRVRVG